MSKLLFLFPLLILSACDGGEAGSPTDPASPPASSEQAGGEGPSVTSGEGDRSPADTDRAAWLPADGAESEGTQHSAAMSAAPVGAEGDEAGGEAGPGGAQVGRCEAACGQGEVCDPASGGCVPHCAESACVNGWSCDGRSGLCVPDRPDCGRCREGQVCDPEVRVCVAHCSWAGCSDDIGRCDRETGFCVE